MRLRLLVLVAQSFLVACASTQQMHFAEFSPANFSLPKGALLGSSEGVSRVTVSGGDYTKVGEFEDYSWHGFVDAAYQGFRRLPYEDPNRQVQAWISDLLDRNGLVSRSPSAPSLEVRVRKLKLKTQRGGSYDYRACQAGLTYVIRDRNGAVVREGAVEGLAKLAGADMIVTGREGSGPGSAIAVRFSPDEPAVCKLAIANALRAAPR